MNPKVWGPHAWIFLHSITLNYPLHPNKQVMKQYYNFFTNLMYVLPCDKCKKHYRQNLKKYPLTNKILSSRERLIKWLINIHNCVNETKQYSYDEMMDNYNNLYNNANNANNGLSLNMYIIIFVMIIIIVCVIFKNYLKN